MSALLNKVSGIYGILAIFAGTRPSPPAKLTAVFLTDAPSPGAEISALQLSMFIYSILLGIALIIISPRLHKRDPLATLSFAYLYVIDSFISALYTLLFGISWFLVLSSKHYATGGTLGNADKTRAGFAGAAFNMSHADVISSPAVSGQGAVAVGANFDGVGVSSPPSSFLSSEVLQPESATSILIISILWVIRAYFILIVLAFARNLVRDSATPGEEPFTGRNYGDGWKDRLGRMLVGVNKVYWQGADGWERFGSKFRRSEEERRSNGNRRSSLPPV